MNYERCADEDADSKITITKNRLTGKLITGDNAVRLLYSESSKRIQSKNFFDGNKEYSCFRESDFIELEDFDEELF